MQDIIEEYAEKRAQMAVAEAERENNKKKMLHRDLPNDYCEKYIPTISK